MKVTDIVNPANLVYKKNSVLNDLPMHYCPGCSHGVVHKLLGDIIEELDIQEQTIGVAPVGCAVFAYKYLDIDWQQAAHGRAPALATAIKRLLPDRYVFTYQGDGDLAAIGVPKLYMPAIVVKISLSSTSTTDLWHDRGRWHPLPYWE